VRRKCIKRLRPCEQDASAASAPRSPKPNANSSKGPRKNVANRLARGNGRAGNPNYVNILAMSLRSTMRVRGQAENSTSAAQQTPGSETACIADRPKSGGRITNTQDDARAPDRWIAVSAAHSVMTDRVRRRRNRYGIEIFPLWRSTPVYWALT